MAVEGREAREAFRAEVMGNIPSSYSPVFHVLAPAFVGIGLIAASIALLRDVRWWELLIVPFVYMLSNATEHRAHRLALHRRTKGLELLYDRHTPIHHRIFIAADMSIRDNRECALVLLPWFAIVAIVVLTAPFTIGLAFVDKNLACLFLATCVFYVLSYEWLHLAYHLPKTSFIGRLGVVRVLRRHHATHHHPPLMQKWNFNVTVPLWDWVRGTTYREPLPEIEAIEAAPIRQV
jgi:sterol desaturase/sphingolipid hydroxylase (fatty acid hydroxylase superfamily)